MEPMGFLKKRKGMKERRKEWRGVSAVFKNVNITKI